MTAAKAVLASVAASLVAFLGSPGGAALAMYLALNVLNAFLGKPAPLTNLSPLARLDRLVDRLVVICRHGAINRLSAPVFGVSLFAETKAFFEDERKIEDSMRSSGERNTVVPPESQRALFGDLGLWATMVALMGALLLVEACRPRDPDGCQPFATRCSPLGIPQVCSQGGYWSQSMADECPDGSVCGLARVGLLRDGQAPRTAHRCALVESLIDAARADP